jgi:ribonuclease T1
MAQKPAPNTNLPPRRGVGVGGVAGLLLSLVILVLFWQRGVDQAPFIVETPTAAATPTPISATPSATPFTATSVAASPVVATPLVTGAVTPISVTEIALAKTITPAPTTSTAPSTATSTPTATPTTRPTLVTPTPKMATATATTRPTESRGRSGLPVIDYHRLPSEAQTTIRLIEQGGPFPFWQDDAIFQNRERLLPNQPRGYYHEYTVITPGARDRSARRVVAGAQGELYYTDDHYASFWEVAR